jgi:carboxymethylenebutenolidase
MPNDDREPPGTVTRREFLVTALAAGFAAAVSPTDMEIIVKTDKNGLIAGPVTISVPGGRMPAYRAMPLTAKRIPIVLVVEEIFGVHEHIQDVCRRVAKEGYFAVAPELFARQGDPTKIADPKRIIEDIVAKTPDAQVMADLDATVNWAVKSGADPKRVAITGFCWGGRIVWLYAAHSPQLKTGVAWYGRLDGDRNALQPKYPLDIAHDLKIPVLGLYGGKDDSIPSDQIAKMRTALEAGTSKSEIVVYPDAPHGFHADYRPSYREKDAKDGWKRLLAWFTEHGLS